jgi:hypothetical protein
LNIEKNQIPWLKMLKTTFSPEKPAKNDGSIHHFWTCSFGPVRTETEVFHLAAEAQKVLPLKDFPSLSRDDRELNLDAGNVERCSWGTRTRNRKNLFFFSSNSVALVTIVQKRSMPHNFNMYIIYIYIMYLCKLYQCIYTYFFISIHIHIYSDVF